MKKFFHNNCSNFKDYDALTRRGNVEVDFSFAEKGGTKLSTNKENNLSRQQSFMSGGGNTAPTNKKMVLPPKGFANIGKQSDSLNNSKNHEKGGGMSSNSGSTANLLGALSNRENETIAELHSMIEK